MHQIYQAAMARNNSESHSASSDKYQQKKPRRKAHMFTYAEEEICGTRSGFEQTCSVLETCARSSNSLNHDATYTPAPTLTATLHESYGGPHPWLSSLLQLLVPPYHFSFVETKIEQTTAGS